MKYVFGPVPSRRLGRSLGIDTVPLKTCNWNCVYCQLGRTTPVVHERKHYLPTDAIFDEVRQALATIPPDKIDWITFVASGEGTLHLHMDRMVREVKRMTDLPVAVITNGSLLGDPDLRQSLTEVDAVLPTLDAGSDELYRRINRPHPRFAFQQHVTGLKSFARMPRHARLWIEIMLVAGLNDTEVALRQLADMLDGIAPDEVHLTLPTRCPAETWVRPPEPQGLLIAQSILGPRARIFSSYAVKLELDDVHSVENQIVSIVTRHPMRVSELEEAARTAFIADLHDRLKQLCRTKQVQLIKRNGEEFVCGGNIDALT